MAEGAKAFRFDDLNAKPREDGASAPSFTTDDVETARAAGVIEGRRLAAESIAAEEAAQLARIGDLIEGDGARFAQFLAEERRALRDVARAFLEEFCDRICAAREVELAADLLRRLTENSEDRRCASLILSPASADRLAERILAVAESRAIADMISLGADPALRPGEVRLEWRGGKVQVGRAEIAAAIGDFIDTLQSFEKEAHP